MKRAILVLLTIALLFPMNLTYAGETLNGAGATFPYPLYSAWAYQYQKKTGVRVNYQSIGSGGGVRQIVNRTIDFGASDDALPPEEIEKNKLLQWPQVIGAVVPVVNLPGVKASQMALDAPTLCGIFLGEITNWSDPGIKALNPSLKLPDRPIKVVYRSDGSGTTAVFTHYLDEACPAWHERVGTGKAVKWPTGIGAKGNEGVANYVKRLRYSIGYVEFAYAVQNRLTFVSLKNPAGRVVKPSIESFKEAASGADFDPDRHFYTWLTNTKAEGAWPIVAATNILLAREKVETNRKVIRFFDWAFSPEADETALRLHYAPLPAPVKEKVRQYWKRHGIY